MVLAKIILSETITLTQSQVLELWQVSAGTQLVEDVVIPLVTCLANGTKTLFVRTTG